jgi:hypothetical protein
LLEPSPGAARIQPMHGRDIAVTDSELLAQACIRCNLLVQLGHASLNV